MVKLNKIEPSLYISYETETKDNLTFLDKL